MAEHVTGFATDVNNSQFAGASDPDAIMRAVFYVRPCYNEWETKKQGRPIYDDIIYCKYGPAGSTQLEMDIRSNNSHEKRFFRQWALFQAGHGADAQRAAGTPLKQWPVLTPSAVEELAALKFYTIDQIAAASDTQLAPLGMGFLDMGPFTLRAKAQAYLGAAKDSALPQAQAAEINSLKQEMAARDEKHAKEMEDLRALIMANAPKRYRRGKKEMLAARAPTMSTPTEQSAPEI